LSALRVCIDARLISGTVGGVEQFVLALAAGLSALTDGDEEYCFLTSPDCDDWLKPHVGGPCRILQSAAATRYPRWLRPLRRSRLVARALQKIVAKRDTCTTLVVPRSDGTLERHGGYLGW